MKIYLAARYSRNDEMRGIRDVLERMGHKVTSRWIDCHPDTNGTPELENSLSQEALTAAPEVGARFAQVDVADLEAADVVISFTSPDGGGKGGRHIEFGYGLARGKQMILVGPRENVFHTLPEVERYRDWPHLLVTLTEVAANG